MSSAVLTGNRGGVPLFGMVWLVIRELMPPAKAWKFITSLATATLGNWYEFEEAEACAVNAGPQATALEGAYYLLNSFAMPE